MTKLFRPNYFRKSKLSDIGERQMLAGLNLKPETILDHILDHLKEETC